MRTSLRAVTIILSILLLHNNSLAATTTTNVKNKPLPTLKQLQENSKQKYIKIEQGIKQDTAETVDFAKSQQIKALKEKKQKELSKLDSKIKAKEKELQDLRKTAAQKPKQFDTIKQELKNLKEQRKIIITTYTNKINSIE